MTTTNHKTGKYYTVHIFIQPDKRQFLRAMKAKFIEEFNSEPSYIFASSVNKVETSISRGLQESFQEIFGEYSEKVRYNANSIRKLWERLWNVIKSKVSDGITKALFAQTTHSEKTAREKYLHRNGTEEEIALVLEIYSDRLANRRDDEDCLSEKSSEAPPDERPDSDLEDESPELPVLDPSFQKVETVARFNLGRDSLQTSTVRTPRYMRPSSDCAATASCAANPSGVTISTNTSRPTKTGFMELTKGFTDWQSGHQVPHFDVQLQSQEGSSRMERGFQEGLLPVQRCKRDYF